QPPVVEPGDEVDLDRPAVSVPALPMRPLARARQSPLAVAPPVRLRDDPLEHPAHVRVEVGRDDAVPYLGRGAGLERASVRQDEAVPEGDGLRSEERRVGKERSAEGSTET